VSVRGAVDYDLTRRTVADQSAIQRTRAELVDPATGGIRDDARHPQLFSVFLDSSRRPPRRRELVFTAQLTVSTTEYEVGNSLLTRTHIPGEFLFRDTVVVRATPPGDEKEEWKVGFVLSDNRWSDETFTTVALAGGSFSIPLVNDKGFAARLVLRPRPWD
jgi:hypothetical protein